MLICTRVASSIHLNLIANPGDQMCTLYKGYSKDTLSIIAKGIQNRKASKLASSIF